MAVKNRIAQNPPIIGTNNLPLLLDEFQTAELLGVSVSFLRKSRCEGERNPDKILSGSGSIYENPAPPFVRLNKQTVRYAKSDLELWVQNLSRRTVI